VPAATYALIGYALLIVVIGVLGARKTRSFSDFMLGGRGIGPWMTAFSYGTAYFSAVLFIGFAGKIGWGFGLSGLWIALGNTLVGVLLVWWVLGARIRRVTAEYGVHTLPELLEARYGSRVLKLLTSLAIFVFFIPYSAAVFMGLGYLFTSNFGISYELMILLIGGFTGVYLVLGGYKSMAMIDVIFGIVMTVGVVVLLWSCLDRGGGFDRILVDLAEKDERLVAPVGPPGLWPLLSLVFLTSVAPIGMPQLVQKFYAIKDRRSIRIGMIASTLFAVLVTGTAYFTGALTRLFITPETHAAVFAGREAGLRRPHAGAPDHGRPAGPRDRHLPAHPLGLDVDARRARAHLELHDHEGPLRGVREAGRVRPDADPAGPRLQRVLHPPVGRPRAEAAGRDRDDPLRLLGSDRVRLPGAVPVGPVHEADRSRRRARRGAARARDLPRPLRALGTDEGAAGGKPGHDRLARGDTDRGEAGPAERDDDLIPDARNRRNLVAAPSVGCDPEPGRRAPP
jgi:hypothetical protein